MFSPDSTVSALQPAATIPNIPKPIDPMIALNFMVISLQTMLTDTHTTDVELNESRMICGQISPDRPRNARDTPPLHVSPAVNARREISAFSPHDFASHARNPRRLPTSSGRSKAREKADFRR
jgi:hypothetical protein